MAVLPSLDLNMTLEILTFFVTILSIIYVTINGNFHTVGTVLAQVCHTYAASGLCKCCNMLCQQVMGHIQISLFTLEGSDQVVIYCLYLCPTVLHYLFF